MVTQPVAVLNNRFAIRDTEIASQKPLAMTNGTKLRTHLAAAGRHAPLICGHGRRRFCRAPAAQEELDHLGDEQQHKGQRKADQPLLQVEAGQAEPPLNEAQLRRQKREQQRHPEENQLVAVRDDVAV